MKIIGVKGYHIILPVETTYPVDKDGAYSHMACSSTAENDAEVSVTGTYVVKVVTDCGMIGYGECPTNYGTRGLLNLAGENIFGADPADVLNIMEEQLLGRKNASGSAIVHPCLKMSCELNAIEFALWDIIAKKAGLPVNRILGGNLRKKVAIADNIGFMPIVDCLRRIDGDIKNGVRTIKLRIAANDNACIDLLREIRNQFGWELIIRLDAAGAWDDVGEAARILSRVEPYDIQYVQDALDRTDGESFRRLRDITGIPVAIGRAFGGGQITAREARTKLMNFIRADAIDVLAVSPAEAGGLYGFTKLAAMCDGASVNVVAGNARGSLSQAIWATGCIICRSTAYAHDIIPTGMPGGVLKDVSTKQITFDNGYIWPFNGQGFGVEPDWELLQSYCIATEQAGGID